jgi:HAD superfamily hydrolase (TIGR01509 family)
LHNIVCYSPRMAAKAHRRIRGVLFDWDGTLLNSYDADSSAYLEMFCTMRIPWGLAELAVHYSPNWYDVYRAAKLPRDQWDAADIAWRKCYATHQPKLMKNARRTLTRVRRKYRVGLVTSGDRGRVTRQLREFSLTRDFAVRVCGDDTVRKKPHPAPLLLALRGMRLQAASCVYVGDSPEDLEMARRAGVRSIAVLGCFPTEKRLRAARPEVLLKSIEELPEALERMNE